MGAFQDVAEASAQMQAIYKIRADHLTTMCEHLMEMQIWATGIAKRGISEDAKLQEYQTMRFEHIVYQMHLDLDRLQNIHYNEMILATDMAAKVLELHKSVDTHGYPIGKGEDAI